MRLSSANSRFAIVRTAFHGGGVLSYHLSLSAAEAAKRRGRVGLCCCGCCAVIPVTAEAVEEMRRSGGYIDIPPLLAEIPEYTGNEFSPYTICK